MCIRDSHNHGPGSRYNTIEDSLAAIDGLDERIGCIVDSGHYLRSDINPAEAVHVLRGRVHGVHLKSVAARTADAPDTIVGRGELEGVAFHLAVAESGLPADVSISLEYEANLDPFEDLVESLDLIDMWIDLEPA